MTGNSCSNFPTLNGYPNGSLNSNLNNSPNVFTNSLGNLNNNNLSNQPNNFLATSNLANNFSSNYCYDYPNYSPSSNSSSTAPNGEYDYSQQNLVTNSSETNLNSNLIPSYHSTFSQGVSFKDQQANHPTSDHRIDHLIGNGLVGGTLIGTSNNLISSNNSISSNGSSYQADAPCINIQPGNRSHPQLNHVQNTFPRSTNLLQENCFDPYRSPGHSSSPYSYHPQQQFNTIEELQYDQCPRQSIRSGVDSLDSDHSNQNGEQEMRKKMNNKRERVRVQKMNYGFEKLAQTCIEVTKKDEKLTKYLTLKRANSIISGLEGEVNVSCLSIGNLTDSFN